MNAPAHPRSSLSRHLCQHSATHAAPAADAWRSLSVCHGKPLLLQTNSQSLTIRIRPTFSITIRPNTNTLFGLLFGPNRIRIEYSVQPYLEPKATLTTDINSFEEAHSVPVRQFKCQRIHYSELRNYHYTPPKYNYRMKRSRNNGHNRC